MSTSILAMWMPGVTEMIVIGGVALLIFGRRLPDVARSVGKSIVEFKRGLRDVKDDIDTQSRIDSASPTELPGSTPRRDDDSPTAPEPPKSSTPS